MTKKVVSIQVHINDYYVDTETDEVVIKMRIGDKLSETRHALSEFFRTDGAVYASEPEKIVIEGEGRSREIPLTDEMRPSKETL